MAGKLAAMREGRIRRLIISVPPRHLKSHLASVAFPAWCLGHDPSMQIVCVSYAQDLADTIRARATSLQGYFRKVRSPLLGSAIQVGGRRKFAGLLIVQILACLLLLRKVALR
jgi:hypothetical protein